MSQQAHWEQVYSTRSPEEVGWYEPHLETSLEWIKEVAADTDASIIDVGGGASTLVDDLVAEGYRSITVLDLSRTALATAKNRLSGNADAVTWIEGDVTAVSLPAGGYDVWHDRAVFHFLTDDEQKRRYVAGLLQATKPGSHLIMATFAPEAPPRCSGLPVERYEAGQLEAVLGSGFVLRRQRKELHVTPGGTEQMYVYCLFQRAA